MLSGVKMGVSQQSVLIVEKSYCYHVLDKHFQDVYLCAHYVSFTFLILRP